ncbi:MAG TPA: RdgB/HAM1 family non-canonical purine NTP pyrophosphatase [Terriglobales bacterium]|nr:RdgB/HAM1 family non-canonical purine NTP pyrophosphatase [Terriglobales bacterium]
MSTVYIATSNQGKLRDFQTAAAAYNVQIAPVPNIESLPPVVEDQDTFEGNARKKAECYSRAVVGELVLGDDSGLCVEALDGAPGVISARYAAVPGTSNSSDTANNAKLLAELADVPDERRTAHFICVIAVAKDGRTIELFRGHAHGRILHAARGSGGFGYDPLFLFPDLGLTFAELRPEQRIEFGHRGRAFRRFLEWYQKQHKIL